MDETTGFGQVRLWSEADVDAEDVRLHIHRTGHGKLPPLVLAHGLSDNALCWTRVAQALEADFDIVMIDARNHGQSGTAPGGTEAMARDVIAVIESLGLGRAAVIGHSIGARTMAHVATTRPDLVSRLVLDDPPWTVAGHDVDASQSRQAGVRTWLESFASMTDADFEALAHTQHGDWHPDEYPAWIESNKQVRMEAAESLNAPAWPDVVPRIECPTLLLYADPDRGARVTAEAAQLIGELNDRVTSSRIGNAGHNIRRENFDGYMEVVGRFLREPVLNTTDSDD